MEEMIFNGYAGDETVEKVTVESYRGGIALGIQLWAQDEPLALLTVNLGNCAGNGSVVMPYCGWLDVNNAPTAESFVERYGIGTPYTRFGCPVIGYSGFCRYPYFQFSKEKLMELDPEGCRKYEEAYDRGLKKALKEVCG